MQMSAQWFLWWNALAIGLIWVPFALGALLVERWRSPSFSRWRERVAHVVRPRGDHRVAHAH